MKHLLDEGFSLWQRRKYLCICRSMEVCGDWYLERKKEVLQMKRWFVGCVLLVLGCIVLTACGGSASLDSIITSSGSSTQSNGSQSASSQSSSAGTPQTVNVLEGEMYIKSDVSNFTVGTPYHFVVKNE